MKAETAGKIKYGVWSLFIGAVIAMIIGFGWGGVDNRRHDPKDVRGGGSGESGGDLCRPICQTTQS